jgi:hypothetical protein
MWFPPSPRMEDLHWSSARFGNILLHPVDPAINYYYALRASPAVRRKHRTAIFLSHVAIL